MKILKDYQKIMIHKKNIAIIDMAFHKKTKSFNFLKRIFEDETVNVHYFYNDTLEWWLANKEYLNKNFDVYIYLQIIPQLPELQKLKGKNIVLVPMYDWISLNQYSLDYLKCFNIKILCFSNKLYNFVNWMWFDSLYIQYFLIKN